MNKHIIQNYHMRYEIHLTFLIYEYGKCNRGELLNLMEEQNYVIQQQQ